MAIEESDGSDERPLAGCRVIDAASLVAGPSAAAVLGEFGAEVIKVERPDTGDAMRTLGTDAGQGTYWWLNETRNKHSVALDLRTPEGSQGLRDLAECADVLIENFRPGTMDRWGLGYEALRAANPRLIQVSVTGYGQTGPMAGVAGVARIAEAFTGMTHLTGNADSPPGLSGSSALADYTAGLYGALGVMMALEARRRTGEGQLVDVALYDGMARFLDELVPTFLATGVGRERLGAETHRSVPHTNYQAGDAAWVTIACTNDSMFNRLAAAMGEPSLVDDSRFTSNSARIENREAVNRVVGAWVAGRAANQVVAACAAASVPCGMINTVGEYCDSPQVAARDSIVTIPTPGGPISVNGVVPRLSDTPGRVDRLGCDLGELDIDEVVDRWRVAAASYNDPETKDETPCGN